MRYTLMLRDMPVAKLLIDFAEEEYPIDILDIMDIDRMPFPVQYADDKPEALLRFFLDRLAISSRDDIAKLVQLSGFESLLHLVLEQHLLSLQDQYWIKTTDDYDIFWEDINFFDNGYPLDIGNMLFGYNIQEPIFVSPDWTATGMLTKSWRMNHGKHFLVKAGSPPYYQEPYNEALASKIAAKICHYDCVEYNVINIGGRPASICQSFLDEHTMLVSAQDICNIMPKMPGEDLYDHFSNCAKFLGIKNFKQPLETMLAFDYVIGNRDRHLGNFGFLYDTEMMHFIKMAPFYDNGASLWGDCKTELIAETENDSAKPFGIDFTEQISHIKNISRDINFHQLDNIADLIPEVFDGYDNQRTNAIMKKFTDRLEIIKDTFTKMKNSEPDRLKFRMGQGDHDLDR